MDLGLGSAGGDGWAAEEIFEGAQNGFSFDDIVFMPGYVSFDASAASLSTRLTRNIMIELPLVGSPSDAVTEAVMARELALSGGIGFIHCNQSVQSQVEMVQRVKRSENGFMYEPMTLSPQHTVADVDRIKKMHGFSGIPITENGELGGRVLGIITARDIDPIDDRSVPIEKVMTKQGLVLGQDGISLTQAFAKLMENKVGKLPIVNDEKCLVAMVSRRDAKRSVNLKQATRDSKGQLMVGAAVSADGIGDWERAVAVVEAGADLVYVNTAASGSSSKFDFIARLKAQYPHIDVAAGPVSACREAKSLCDAGVDAVVIGSPATSLGSGGEGGGFGRPEATAVYEVSRYVSLNYGLPTIAQGGLRNSGQILKALGLGASAVLLDDLFAASQEVSSLAPYIASALRNGLCDLGLKSVPDLHRALSNAELRMECRSSFSEKRAELKSLATQQSQFPYIQSPV
jgi:IMP dehydrogenase